MVVNKHWPAAIEPAEPPAELSGDERFAWTHLGKLARRSAKQDAEVREWIAESGGDSRPDDLLALHRRGLRRARGLRRVAKGGSVLIGFRRFDGQQDHARLDGLAHLDLDAGHATRAGSLELVFHLHRLDDDRRRAGLDLVARRLRRS